MKNQALLLCNEIHLWNDHRAIAAAELRRLHEANKTMLDALRPFANYACDEPCSCHNCAARAAIAKGEQQ